VVDDGSSVIDREELVIGSSAKGRIEAYEGSSLHSTRGTPGIIIPPSTAEIPSKSGRTSSTPRPNSVSVPLRHVKNHQWQKQIYP